MDPQVEFKNLTESFGAGHELYGYPFANFVALEGTALDEFMKRATFKLQGDFARLHNASLKLDGKKTLVMDPQVEFKNLTESFGAGHDLYGYSFANFVALKGTALDEFMKRATFKLQGDFARLHKSSQPGQGSKRPVQEEVYCYTPKRIKQGTSEGDEKVEESLVASKRPEMESLAGYKDVVRFTFLNGTSFIWFGIKQYLPDLKSWISHLLHPTSSVQRKQLLLVHGAVKSGKTTLIRDALPHLLSQLQVDMDDFRGKTFCFAFIDLSSLTHINTANEKWRHFWYLLETAFPGRLSVDLAQNRPWHIEVKQSLMALKNAGEDVVWFISLDEFHYLFSGLDADQVANLAETAKHIFLDNDSPCHFLLGGSTQATFWSAVGKAKDNGLRILHEAHVITTPFSVPQEKIDECGKALVEQKVASAEVVLEAAAALLPGQRTPVNLTQVVLLSSVSKSVREAYKSFLHAKQSVFLRDYTDLPDADMVNLILHWVDGSAAEPPHLYSFLLEQRGKLFYVRDDDFKAFLAQYYNATQNKIVRSAVGVLPIHDILMFIQLIPLGQLQTEHKIDETFFEPNAAKFAADNFVASKESDFKNWLVNGPDPSKKLDKTVNPNYTYPPLHPNPAVTLTSWVLVIRLLRNIFSHQKDVTWQDLRSVKKQVLAYMKTPRVFAEFVNCYEQCRY